MIYLIKIGEMSYKIIFTYESFLFSIIQDFDKMSYKIILTYESFLFSTIQHFEKM